MTVETALVPFNPDAPAWSGPDLSILGDDLPDAPPAPLSCLTDDWRQWVEEAAQGKSCPVDFVLGGLLVSVAALLSGARSASPWEGWIEPAILWGALVGNPSSGKSPALDTVLGPMREIENEWSEGFEQTLRQHASDVEHARVVKDKWRDSMQVAAKAGRAIPELPAEAMEPDEPQRPRLVTSDSTIEKLALILSGNKGRGLLSYRDELSGWFLNFERHGGSDRGFWVESFGGRPYTVDRVKNLRPVQIDSLAVSIAGAIQPDKLRGLVVKSDDDGMAARFLFFYPQGGPPFRRPKRLADRDFIGAAFSRMASLEAIPDEKGHCKSLAVLFSPDAADILETWRRDTLPVHERMARGFLLSAVGKLPGILVRLSLVFEYLSWASGSPEPQTITASSVDAALAFVEEYALPMARRALAAGSQSVEAKNAALVAQWLLDAVPERVNLRTLTKFTPGFPVGDAAALAGAVPLLEEANFLRMVQGPGGHRPKKDYLVSPLLPVAKRSKRSKSIEGDDSDIERAAIQAVDGRGA
jgi:hypothetical protein